MHLALLHQTGRMMPERADLRRTTIALHPWSLPTHETVVPRRSRMPAAIHLLVSCVAVRSEFGEGLWVTQRPAET